MFGGIKKRAAQEEFFPGALSFFVNPYYITRASLVRNIKAVSSEMRGSILDFGCGSKPYQSLFTGATSYIGVDVEISGHDHAQSLVDVFYKDNKLPFEDASFDNIVTFEVFEHVINLDEMVPELARVIRPGGKMLVTVPFMYPEHEMPYDFRRLSVNGLRTLLDRAGFDMIQSRRYPSAALSIAQLFMHVVYSRLARGGSLVKAAAHLLLNVPVQIVAHLLGGMDAQDGDLYLGSMIVVRKR